MKINVTNMFDFHANIDQLPMKRDWMENTYERHAYHCFPLSLSNRLGWGISFPEDISVVWNGSYDAEPSNEKVTILSGEKFVNVNRANHTISFETGLRFDGENGDNITLLTMPVPNDFVRGAQCFTTLVSTSALPGSLPLAWMVTEPNLEINIPAGTPVAAVLPISLTDIQGYELVVSNNAPPPFPSWMKDRGDAAQEKNAVGDWSHFYRDAIDHLGRPFGKHESKKIIMNVTRKN